MRGIENIHFLMWNSNDTGLLLILKKSVTALSFHLPVWDDWRIGCMVCLLWWIVVILERFLQYVCIGWFNPFIIGRFRFYYTKSKLAIEIDSTLVVDLDMSKIIQKKFYTEIKIKY